MIIFNNNEDLTPNRILRKIVDSNNKGYTYIVLGCPGPTGKTWIKKGLKQYGFNVFEISEDVSDLVKYKRSPNRVIVNEIEKTVVVVLNETWKISGE